MEVGCRLTFGTAACQINGMSVQFSCNLPRGNPRVQWGRGSQGGSAQGSKSDGDESAEKKPFYYRCRKTISAASVGSRLLASRQPSPRDSWVPSRSVRRLQTQAKAAANLSQVPPLYDGRQAQCWRSKTESENGKVSREPDCSGDVMHRG